MYPKNKKEWWECVEKNWENLKALIENFHPSSSLYSQNDLLITAAKAEHLCEQYREEIRKQVKEDPTKLAEGYMLRHDPKLADILNETWFGMPESVEVRSYPGFNELCDLCSESYLLGENDE